MYGGLEAACMTSEPKTCQGLDYRAAEPINSSHQQGTEILKSRPICPASVPSARGAQLCPRLVSLRVWWYASSTVTVDCRNFASKFGATFLPALLCQQTAAPLISDI